MWGPLLTATVCSKDRDPWCHHAVRGALCFNKPLCISVSNKSNTFTMTVWIRINESYKWIIVVQKLFLFFTYISLRGSRTENFLCKCCGFYCVSVLNSAFKRTMPITYLVELPLDFLINIYITNCLCLSSLIKTWKS